MLYVTRKMGSTLKYAFILKVMTGSLYFQPPVSQGFRSLRAGRHEHSLVKKEEVSRSIQNTTSLLPEPVEVTMLLSSLCVALLLPVMAPVDAQYETYSFKSFPQKDIMPLDTAYGHALEQYGAQNWAESIKYLELSLRLHRLLRDSEAFCGRNCSSVSRDNDTLSADSSLRLMRHILLRAACLKKCKADFSVFSVSYPRRDVLETFEQRVPYRYIQYAHYQVRLNECGPSAPSPKVVPNTDTTKCE